MTDCAKYFRLLQYFWIFDSKNIEIVLKIFELHNRVPNWQLDFNFDNSIQFGNVLSRRKFEMTDFAK